jgi:FixJ family two-component response regulator
MPATVWVVDDDPAVAASLRWLIESVGLRVETFNDPQVFYEQYDPLRPGCLIFDLRMPGMSGLELQERMNRLDYHAPILFITGHGAVSSAVRAFKAGAVDFIEKPFHDEELIDRLQKAIERDRLQRALMAERLAVKKRLDALTARERDVMHLVIEGRSNKVIAAQLGISPKTVETHRARVMEKMEAESVSALVRMALQADAPLA